MQIKITIPGAPAAKGRPKFRRIGSFVQAYTPTKTHKAEQFVAKCFKEQAGCFKMPDNGPICLSIEFFMPIPTSLSKKKQKELLGEKHLKRPDLDNLVKLVCDGLNGVAWKDDSCISSMVTTKQYSDNPRTVVFIEYL